MAQQPYVSFIPNVILEAEVSLLLLSAAAAASPARNIDKNIIDPFGIVFEMAGFKLPNLTQWQANERQRQAQKTLQNALGAFHQNLLGSIHINGTRFSRNLNNGHNSGMDVEVPSMSIIADVKNKHNTLNAGGKLGVYDAMRNLISPKVSPYHLYTAYYVEMLSKKPIRAFPNGIEFTPADSSTGAKKPANPNIRQISGRNFYALITGIPNALDLVYTALPQVIANVSPYAYSPADIAAMNTYFQSACA